MKLYNTLTKRKEEFKALNPPIVRIYFCGITPYDVSHVGHLRSHVAVDLLRRVLRFLGYIDFAVSNFTDIDDKIIKKAKETGKDWKEISETYIKYHLEALKELNILPFYINPKVTEHIKEITDFIRVLEKKGYAYKGKYGVYFEVDKYPYYGQLSGIKNKEAWRQETDVLEDKKKPYDFALWKFRKPGEPYWNSPWGEGRPGWHIECSVMSSRYLGEQFDIHAGGQDLIFPHHENEIAQSEARFGKHPWVKYWFHIGFVTINKEKMSKSLGNIIPAKDFIKQMKPMPARFFLISTHYREPLDINEEALNQAKENYQYITSTIKTVIARINELEPTYYLPDEKIKILNKLLDYHKRFIETILDDLDTTKATAILLEATKFINKEVLPTDIFALNYATYEFYNTVNRIYAVWDDIFYKREKEDLIPKLIDLILEVRKELRKEKRYDLADKIRERLKELGIEVMDKGLESYWRLL